MRLRNKKTGEIVCARFCGVTYDDDDDHLLKMWLRDDDYEYEYNTLAELNEEWEDYEGPKGIWWLDNEGNVNHATSEVDDNFEKNREIGNYFETRGEAEKAVEKLKAWKRLRDKGFKFEGIKEDYTRILQSQDPFRTGKRYLQFNKSEDEDWMGENWEDLDLLFGGEE